MLDLVVIACNLILVLVRFRICRNFEMRLGLNNWI